MARNQADIDRLVGLTGEAGPADVESLVELASTVATRARDIDTRIVSNLDAIRDVVGEGQMRQVLAGPKSHLKEIHIQPQAERYPEILRSLQGMFGDKNVITDELPGGRKEIRVLGGTEIGKRRLAKAAKAMGQVIKQQAVGTIGGVERLGAKTKLTPEGTRGFLEETFGAQNVWPAPGDTGNFFVKSGGEWRWLDQPGAEPQDVVDVIPEIGQAVAGMAGAYVGGKRGGLGGTVGGGLADTASELARQGLSGVLPGEDFPRQQGLEELATRAKMVGQNVAAGVGGEAILGMGRAIDPQRAVGRKIGREIVTETPEEFLTGGGKRARQIAEERTALGEKHGVGLSMGEATGSPTIQRLEALLSAKPLVADMMAKFRSRRLSQLSKAFGVAIEQVGGKRVGAQQATENAAGAYRTLLGDLGAERKTVAAQLYKRAAEPVGDAKIIQLDHTAATIREIAEESKLPLAPPGTDESRKLIEQLSPEGGLPNAGIEELQRTRSAWGRRIKTDQTGTAKRIFSAINKDMDAAATASRERPFAGPGGQIAEQPAQVAEAIGRLREANEAYKLMSARIDAVGNDVALKKITGLSDALGGGKMPGWVLSDATTTEQVGSFVTMMRQSDPSAVAQVRGEVLQGVLSKATKGTTDPINPAALNKALTDADDKLRVLFRGSEQSYQLVREIRKLSEIAANKPGKVGSEIAGMFVFAGALKAFSEARWNPRQFLSQAALLLTETRMAKILNDPRRSKEFLQIIKKPPGAPAKWAQRAIRASSRLVATLNREEGIDDE